LVSGALDDVRNWLSGSGVCGLPHPKLPARESGVCCAYGLKALRV
jgi:hypothetical protein